MRFSTTSSASLIAGLAGLGVLVAGVTDWLQGSAPAGIVSLPDGLGLAAFIGCVLGTVVCSIAAGETSDRRNLGFRIATVVLAASAAAIGDPTYTTLLLAIPLIEAARRRSGRRAYVVAALFGLAGVLVAIENQSWAGNGLEATLVLFIALVITTLLGHALGELDEARRLETDLARADERDHLARELHDSVGPQPARQFDPAPQCHCALGTIAEAALQSVELASRAVGDALVDTRIAVDTIRSQGPPFSLQHALPGLLDRISSPTMTTNLTIDGATETIDPLVQITLYRVAQEALTNAVRHADASHVDVTNTVTDTRVELIVADNGRGFNVDASGVHAGMQSMTERLARVGGSIDVTSSSQAGTSVRAEIALR